MAALKALVTKDLAAVSALTAALRAEAEAPVRVAILEALETVAPGTRQVLDAHVEALKDRDPRVREAAAHFGRVPTDDAVLAALKSALDDDSEPVRAAASRSLCEIMFLKPQVIPTLIQALGESAQCQNVATALDEHLQQVSDRAEFGRLRGDLTGLRATLASAVPALQKAVTSDGAERRARAFEILGRITAFSDLNRDAELLKAIEPAIGPYLVGLESDDPGVRRGVLGRLGSIGIHRARIVGLLLGELARPGLNEDDRQAALAALAAQATHAGGDSELHTALLPAIPELATALESPAAELRGRAVVALGHIGSAARPALETLRRLAEHDPDAGIRRNAADAVRAVEGTAPMPVSSPRGAGAGAARPRRIE